MQQAVCRMLRSCTRRASTRGGLQAQGLHSRLAEAHVDRVVAAANGLGVFGQLHPARRCGVGCLALGILQVCKAGRQERFPTACGMAAAGRRIKITARTWARCRLPVQHPVPGIRPPTAPCRRTSTKAFSPTSPPAQPPVTSLRCGYLAGSSITKRPCRPSRGLVSSLAKPMYTLLLLCGNRHAAGGSRRGCGVCDRTCDCSRQSGSWATAPAGSPAMRPFVVESGCTTWRYPLHQRLAPATLAHRGGGNDWAPAGGAGRLRPRRELGWEGVEHGCAVLLPGCAWIRRVVVRVVAHLKC